MNKFPIVAIFLLLVGLALTLNSNSISCPFAGENNSCMVNGTCIENCTCPNDAACAQNCPAAQNCSEFGACPVDAEPV